MCFAHVLEGDCTIEAMDVHVERHRSSFGRKFETTVGVRDRQLMGADLPCWRDDYLFFVAPRTDADTRSEWVRPNLSASAAAPLRVVAPSLPRIADTWCSTVLTEMNKLAEISSLD